MVKAINFFPNRSERIVADEPAIVMKNRFVEGNPRLNDSPYSFIARPGMTRFVEVGTGHVRKVFSSAGCFESDLFVVSGVKLYRGNYTGTFSDKGTISTDANGSVSMCAVAPIGTTPAFLYIAEGGVLWVYTDNGQAQGHLEVSGTLATNDVFEIGGIYYQLVAAGDVDTGTPNGSVGTPYRVNKATSNTLALTNLYNAINATGEAGVDYSTVINTPHATVFAGSVSGTDMYVYAYDYGTSGNVITSTETAANASWGGATLSGGGSEQLRQVQVPDDSGAISVAQINSYVIVVPVQTSTTNGLFYWIRPGETKIEPTDFATAERSPDGINQVIVFGEMFWLMGQNTTEPWNTTGDPDAPMERFKGILYDRGSWEGSAIQVKDSLVTVDEDGGVWQISGGSQRISTPDIEEKIRRAIQKASLLIGF